MTKECYEKYNEQGLLTPLCHYKVATYIRNGSAESLLEMLPKNNPNNFESARPTVASPERAIIEIVIIRMPYTSYFN